MEFKVGDRVEVKSWEEMEREYVKEEEAYIKCGSVYFSKSMRHLCGRIARIICLNDYSIELEFEDKSGCTDWAFAEEMLKLYESADAGVIKIITRNRKTEVFINGKKVEHITKIDYSCVGTENNLILVMDADSVEIETDEKPIIISD